MTATATGPDPVHPGNGPPPPKSLPTPAEIVAHLDKFIVGQQEAKHVLAAAIYGHYQLCDDFAKNGTKSAARHRHVLMMGPTGVGKTEMFRRLSEFLGVPSVYVSATALTQNGYVGQKPTDILRQLLERAGTDLKQASRGLIFLDEIDKRRSTAGEGPDVAGVGVQMDLLPFLDGSVVSVVRGNTEYLFDTNHLMVIAAGAFSGIGRRPVDRRICGYDRQEITAEDLAAYGLLDEFVGRFSHFVELAPLTVADFERLIDSPQLLAAERRLMELHDIDFTITRRAKRLLAQVASEDGNGARGLPRILKRVLRDVLFSLPNLRGESILVDCAHGERIVVRVENDRVLFEPNWRPVGGLPPSPSAASQHFIAGRPSFFQRLRRRP